MPTLGEWLRKHEVGARVRGQGYLGLVVTYGLLTLTLRKHEVGARVRGQGYLGLANPNPNPNPYP